MKDRVDSQFRDPLPLDFYNRDSVTVARELLGKVLVRRTPQGLVPARSVETEAYLGENDAGSVTISNSPRIGLGKAKDLLLRFFITGNQYVSKLRAAVAASE